LTVILIACFNLISDASVSVFAGQVIRHPATSKLLALVQEETPPKFSEGLGMYNLLIALITLRKNRFVFLKARRFFATRF